MDQFQVHYELFVRHQPGAPWRLEMAGENRAQMVEAAEAMFAEGRVAAVKVSKETLNADTREFQSVSILSRGKVDAGRKRRIIENHTPLCVTPEDLYTVHARDRIGELLEGWLARNKATPFELLHRADLVEKLDAAGNELQHAIQKIAVPEAQARDISVHELMRSFQKLAERAIARVLGDARKGRFPNIAKEGFARVVERVAHEPEAHYLLGAAVATDLAEAENGWSGKVMRLLDLAAAAPRDGGSRKIAFEVLEQPLAEILESKAGLVELLGSNLDLGGQLAAMTRLAACDAVGALVAIEPRVAKSLPPLEGAATRLSEWLSQPPFATARAAVGRRVLRELMGPRRLRPSNPRDEIELLRGLGMALTAAAGQLMPLENVQEAFSARSRTLVTSEFVEALLGRDKTAREETEMLLWLSENVIGAVNKRQAARYLASHVGSLRFETEMRGGTDSAAVRLAMLAAMQKNTARAGLDPADVAPIQAKFGDVGGHVEADAKLSLALAQANAPVMHRLQLLLKLAAGEAAPLGPAADRARAAIMKLLRADATRAELAAAPGQLAQVRDMLQAAGMAA
ncbi:MAG TPA: hypothetical protein VHW60_04480 [Caulobacteraceae bacterium]|nr:hypothetical protein [Caulobacteraceae bacterium]